MKVTEIKVGLSTLTQLNKEIAQNTADIAKLKSAKKEKDVGTVMTMPTTKVAKKKKTKKK